MTQLTPNIGLPYPEATDRVADGWDAIRDLAIATDTAIKADRDSLALKAAITALTAATDRITTLETTVATLSADSGWVAIPLTSPWANYGGYSNAQVRKIGKRCQLRGLVKATSGVANLTVGTIPAGYRPGQSDLYDASGFAYFNTVTPSSLDAWVDLGDISVRIDIGADGVIRPTGKVLDGLTHVPYLSLAGISYIAEA